MNVQSIRQPIALVSSFLVSLILVGCLGGGIDPNEDPVQPSDENAAATADGEGNAVDDNAALNNNAAANGNVLNNENPSAGDDKDGGAINNAADENFLNDVNNSNNKNNLTGGGNGQGNNLFGANPNGGVGNNNLGSNTAKNNFGLNQGDPSDGALINGAGNDILEPNVNKGAIDSEPLAPASDDNVLAPVAANPTTPAPSPGAAGSGVVRYVTPGGSKLYNKPNGEILRDLEQGDHPLVNEEGEWSRTSDGYYVPSASLTAAPIARLKQPKPWR